MGTQVARPVEALACVLMMAGALISGVYSCFISVYEDKARCL